MTEHAVLPVEVASTADSCRVKIWDTRAENEDGSKGAYVWKNHKHYWHWISNNGKLTNKRRCGTCGFVEEVPEYRTESKIPHSHSPAYHATRMEQQPS